jgi:predicted acyltransferase
VLRAQRLVSLDAFRGITIAAMILVNNPGSWRYTHAPLRHAAWNGWTPADLIFPFFLFIVGVAITFSLHASVLAGEARRPLIVKLVRRTLTLFALGIIVNGFPLFQWDVLRFPGVLQRIALCYCFGALMVLETGVRTQALAALTLLIAYTAVMKLVPVPGHPLGPPTTDMNLAAYVDDLLLHDHLLHAGGDPEGILSTFPAFATTLCGVLTGHWLLSTRSASERVAGLFIAGNSSLALGLLMDKWVPINKSLWTTSYVVFTAGMALTVLAMCFWLMDVKGYRRWAKPFVIYGTNPIVAYVLSSLMAKVMLLGKVTVSDGAKIDFQQFVFEHFFLPLARPVDASFLYALAYVLFWLGITAVLYRKRIIIKM